jgi:type II secretory pathway pseudopilin PulG
LGDNQLKNKIIHSKLPGFTIIEIMIVLLLMSALGLGVMNFMRRNQATMKSANISDEMRTTAATVNKSLKNDLSQVVFLYPSCADTNTDATLACSDIIIRGGITPLPGVDKSDIDALADFSLPSNLEDDQSSLSKEADSVRLVLFDFADSFNCRLYGDHAGENPSSAAEEFWARQEECSGKLSTGNIYVLIDTINGSTYANIFQITETADVGTDEIRITHASSSGNKYNQVGGMGIAAYTSEARIYPVRLVEWAIDDDSTLWRREIIPSSSNRTGYQAWRAVQNNVDGLQFNPVTATLSGSVIKPIEHIRTMSFNALEALNDGIEDIRGISPRYVIRGTSGADRSENVDNPFTSTVESDSVPREEFKFFVEMRNRGEE